MASTYYKISHTSPANNSFKYFQLYLYVCSLFSHLLMYLINQLRHLKIYLIKGEKSLSPEVKFFFQAVALWKDEISNEKQEEIPWSSDGLMRKIQRQLIHQARFETKGMAHIDIGTIFYHTFLLGELQCLPCGDTRNLCMNIRIWLLATHSLSSFHTCTNQRIVVWNRGCSLSFRKYFSKLATYS